MVTSFRHPGTVLTDRFFSVPLDHQRPDGEQIEVFAREVAAAGKADADLPWLLFLQGGPGFGAQRPEGRESWLDRALNDFRVLLRLAANEVPVAAAVYYDDMYVDRELSLQTAQAIRGLQAWVTSEYEHDGLRVSNGAVLDRLIGMARGNI